MQAAKRIGTKGQHLALKVLLLQSCAGVVASGIVAILMSLDSGLDALVGVVANILPAGIFAFFAFRFAGASKNDLVVRSFRKGIALKLLFTFLIFAWVFKHTNVQVLPLFIGYIVTLVAQWPGMIYLHRA